MSSVNHKGNEMGAHAHHPRMGTPGEPIFFDHCAECESQSTGPLFFLDPDRMVQLWNQMVTVEKFDGRYRSQAEARAGRWCFNVALFLERFTQVDPWHAPDKMMFSSPFLAHNGHRE